MVVVKMSALLASGVYLYGNYFVNTSHIMARVTIEDGTTFSAPVVYKDTMVLWIEFPPHQVLD